MELKKFEGFLYLDSGVCAAKGFKASGIHCGLSKDINKNDLGMILAQKPCAAAAVYTQNKVKGAPIFVTQRHLKDGIAQAVIVNSKNANTCNADGEEKAEMMCSIVAEELKINKNDVIVASTGVIGQVLNIEPIKNAVKPLVEKLCANGSNECAKAIMTTDTFSKENAVEFVLDGKKVRVGGMAKGSGMIHPNMATTLNFITTDVAISSKMLQRALDEVVKLTYNRLSVDGDTSTNDMVSVMASGLAENKIISENDENYSIFKQALYIVMMNLTRMLAKDGEGATKLIECSCYNAKSEIVAEKIAKSVITSSLVKTAFFGEDANFGRVFCAIGYADANFDMGKVCVKVSSKAGEIDVFENGSCLAFSEEKASEILALEEIFIEINLQNGEETATCWGCDLTYDYVKINGDYRT